MILIMRHAGTFLMMLLSMRLSKKRIESYQNRRLRKLIDYASSKVPYYSRLFEKHGIAPSQIKSLEDLAVIPISGQDDLRGKALEELVSTDADIKRMIMNRTSGSSGKPLTIASTKTESLLFRLLRLRITYYFGRKVRHKSASIRYIRRGSPTEKPFWKSFLSILGLFRNFKVNCIEQPANIFNILEENRPRWLSGYPGTISLVADSMLEKGAEPWNMTGICVGGEVLTGAMRERIEKAFCAPVYNTYGSHEFGIIAWHCKDTGLLHVQDTNVIIEVVKKDGSPALPGEDGEIVATSLSRFAMPFIRYRLGDIVTRHGETCPCGRAFSTLSKVQGRAIDTFLMPDGRSFHPYQIAAIVVDSADWVRQYSLIQERRDRVVLQVVPFSCPPEDEVERLRNEAQSLLGRDVDFRIIFVSEIDRGTGGKFRVSQSLVPGKQL